MSNEVSSKHMTSISSSRSPFKLHKVCSKWETIPASINRNGSHSRERVLLQNQCLCKTNPDTYILSPDTSSITITRKLVPLIQGWLLIITLPKPYRHIEVSVTSVNSYATSRIPCWSDIDLVVQFYTNLSATMLHKKKFTVSSISALHYCTDYTYLFQHETL